MKVIKILAGTPEWHAHRAAARNASDAPAMMGASPYVSRAALIRQRATGVQPEHDDATLARFSYGHEVEPALRAIAEATIGQDLYPMVAVSDDDYLSASFDGVTMDESIICECKQHNAEKIAQIGRDEIPPVDYWQVVHQFAVCEAALECVYVCGEGVLRIPRDRVQSDIKKLRAGWTLFDADVANYQHTPTAVAAVAAPVEGFRALSLRVEGRVLASNLDAFRADAESFIARLPKPDDLQTDQDFATAEAAVKACAEAETRIKSAKDAALAQMADVDAVLRAADTVAETIRAARLALDKVVKTEKESRRATLVNAGVAAIRAHYDGINAMLRYEIGMPASVTADLGNAIKGLKSIDSIRDKIDTAVTHAKIAASQEADRRRLCIAVIDEHVEHFPLIPDAADLVATKSPYDLRNLIAARVAEHEAKLRCQAEEAAERERERIRREEEAKAIASEVTLPSARGTVPSPTTPAAASPRLKLGQINDAIAPLRIDAAGLAVLGFEPTSEGASKLYGVPLARIVEAIVSHLQHVDLDAA